MSKNALSPRDFMNMSAIAQAHQDMLRVDLAYARSDNILFKERIYRTDACLWLYKELADSVFHAARILKEDQLRLVLYDGLRTVDAQEKMLQTQRVRDNPQWLQEPRLLSPPGAGAHPRGMAIDCSLETLDGTLLDMGTAFDFLAENAAAEHNPAHRNYPHLSIEVINNRLILHNAIMGGGREFGVSVMALPQEWWDFRLQQEVYERYTPLRDADLPPEMRMVYKNQPQPCQLIHDRS